MSCPGRGRKDALTLGKDESGDADTRRLPGTSLSKSLAAALLLALPLAGCVQAPSTTPSQTRNRARDAWALGPSRRRSSPPDWWKAFDDPQLDRLVEQLLANNPTLQSALARIRAAQAEVSSAQSLQYPNINIDGTDTAQLVSKDFVYPQRFGGTWQWVGDVEARLRWSLDFWGKQAALIERAQQCQRGGGAGCERGAPGAGGPIRPVLCRAAAGLAEYRHRASDGGRTPDHPGSDAKPRRVGPGE